ncbi:DUF2254 domain-containing protein [Roseomonas sp. KE0001]|uniref:DUF2254 domain-containing protein n=1 Tax=Roseomonas sp. KE0001 TaxID=2479201 RepID=UPI0018DF5CC3|nr:DUF2254 domain-containing protein [Roseomonas sp. KE0001]
MSRWRWMLRRLTRRLWFRAALFSVLAVATALVSAVAAPFIPYEFTAQIGASAVDNILSILASSMLAVTTFSLTTMVSAFSAASNAATPRASLLLIEDQQAQNAISTFLGCFLFSIVGIIALSTGFYGESGRVVLFIVTIGVILWIVVTLLRWIDHLSRFGRLGETVSRVEATAAASLGDWAKRPRLGGARSLPLPAGAVPVMAVDFGYLQHIDVQALSRLAEEMEQDIHLAVLPGVALDPYRPLLHLPRAASPELEERLRQAFTLGDQRGFEQDPRYGMIVLTEIACRALSAATNDTGTAIGVLAALGRLLGRWAETKAEDEEAAFPRLRVPDIAPDVFFNDVFRPIARDGAGEVEVGIRLQKTLAMLARCGQGRLAAPARRLSAEALERAEAAGLLPAEMEILRRAAGALAAEALAAGPERPLPA